MIAVHKTCNMVIEPISKEITGTVFKKKKEFAPAAVQQVEREN